MADCLVLSNQTQVSIKKRLKLSKQLPQLQVLAEEVQPDSLSNTENVLVYLLLHFCHKKCVTIKIKVCFTTCFV